MSTYPEILRNLDRSRKCFCFGNLHTKCPRSGKKEHTSSWR